MTQAIEKSPNLSPAEKLAKDVESNPAEAQKEIAAITTFERLQELAAEMDKQNIAPSPETLTVLQNKYEELEKAEQEELEKLEASERTDRQLVITEARLRMIRTFDIRAKEPCEPSNMEWAASIIKGATKLSGLQWLAETVGATWAKGYFQGINGRSIEHLMAKIGSTLEKNPAAATAVGGFAIGKIGSIIGMMGLNFGANAKLVRLEMLGAIDSLRLDEEQIILSSIENKDLTNAKPEDIANIANLTIDYIKAQRILYPVGTPITITLANVLNRDKTKEDIANNEEKTRMENIKKVWGVSDVLYDESITQYANGVLTVPNKSLQPDGEPKQDPDGRLARILKESKENIPSANIIKVIPSGNPLVEWNDDGTKSVSVSATMPVVPEGLQALLNNPKPPRISIIAIGPNDRNTTNVISYSLNENGRGVLSVPNEKQLISLLAAQVQHLDFLGSEDRASWKLNDSGTFVPKTTPFSPRSS